MPSKTLEDKVSELEKLCSSLNTMLDFVQSQRSELSTDLRETERILQECRMKYDGENIHFRHEVEILKTQLAEQKEERRKDKEEEMKVKDEWGRRIWSFWPNIAGAVVNVCLAAAIAYYIAKH
jgi:hypothetical protein